MANLIARNRCLFLSGLVAFSLLTQTAYGFNGYIDPGSGLLALQTIGSILAAVLYYFRSKIASLFRRSMSRDVVEPENSRVAPGSEE